MSIELVKKLRDQTGFGLKDIKTAIGQVKSDLSDSASEKEILQKAFEVLQSASSKKIEKKAGRSVNAGIILSSTSEGNKYSFMLELNCETDFVARNEKFQEFSANLVKAINESAPTDMVQMLETSYDGERTVHEACNDMIALIGENIKISKFVGKKSDNSLVTYNHGGKLAVLVEFSGCKNSAKDIALHIAANNPVAIDVNSICQSLVSAERELYSKQAKESGKPEEVQSKIVEGKLKKFYADVTLMKQSFVKNDEQTVAEFLKSTSTTISSFTRVVLGEQEEA
jgi:elongation factor Ts